MYKLYNLCCYTCGWEKGRRVNTMPLWSNALATISLICFSITVVIGDIVRMDMCSFRDKPNSILKKIYTTTYRAPHSTSHEVLGQKLPKQLVTEDNEMIRYASNVSTRKTWATNTATPVVHFESWLSCVLHGHGKEPSEGVEPDRKGSVVLCIIARPLWGRCFPTRQYIIIYPVYMQKRQNCLRWYRRKDSIAKLPLMFFFLHSIYVSPSIFVSSVKTDVALNMM